MSIQISHFYHDDCIASWYSSQRAAYRQKRQELARFHQVSFNRFVLTSFFEAMTQNELRKMKPFVLLCPECRQPLDFAILQRLRRVLGETEITIDEEYVFLLSSVHFFFPHKQRKRNARCQ